MINHWAYFWEKNIYEQLHSRKVAGLFSMHGGPIFDILWHMKCGQIYITLHIFSLNVHATVLYDLQYQTCMPYLDISTSIKFNVTCWCGSEQWDKPTLWCPDQLQLHAVWTVPEIVVETWFGKGEQRNRWEKKWNGHWNLNDTAMELIQVELRPDEWMTPCLMRWDHFRCMELQC